MAAIFFSKITEWVLASIGILINIYAVFGPAHDKGCTVATASANRGLFLGVIGVAAVSFIVVRVGVEQGVISHQPKAPDVVRKY